MTTFELWGVPAIFLILGFVLGVWGGAYVKRPKLRFVGGGSGGSGAPDGYQIYNLTVRNMPGWLGLTIGRTVILGLSISGSHRIGTPVMRDPASKCMADLYDTKHKFVAPLWWRVPGDGGTKIERFTTLPSGDQAELLVFVQRNSDRPSYFPFAPNGNGEPKIQADPLRFRDARRFVIRLTCEDGLWHRELTCDATLDYREGQLQLAHKTRRLVLK